MLVVWKWWLLFGCLASFAVHATDFDQVTSLINQRLSYMKDIAGYKVEKNLAIEDLVQEKNVLDAVMRQSAAIGLDPESIKPFFIAQMAAAKAIQYRYRADWLSEPPAGWQPRPLDEVRVHLAQLSATLITELHALLASGAKIDDRFREQFIAAIKQKNLGRAEKEQLFSRLQAVKLIPQ